MNKMTKLKMKSKIKTGLFTLSLLTGAFSANALCTGCVDPGAMDDDIDPTTTYSAIVKQVISYIDASGRYVFYWNYTTLTGNTLGYCEQQVSAATTNPNVSIVQFCSAN